MSPARSQRQIVSDFIMLISNEWTGRVAEVTAALQQVGARVNVIDAEGSVVEGVIRRNDLRELSRLRFARRVTSSATYLLEVESGSLDEALRRAEPTPTSRGRSPRS
jgi:hypothetical protein